MNIELVIPNKIKALVTAHLSCTCVGPIIVTSSLGTVEQASATEGSTMVPTPTAVSAASYHVSGNFVFPLSISKLFLFCLTHLLSTQNNRGKVSDAGQVQTLNFIYAEPAPVE